MADVIAPRKRYVKTVWETWSYDVWGNARDGWDVNDRRCLDRDYQLRIPIEVCNAGTAAAFDHATPTDRQIRAVFGIRCRFETDGDDTSIYVTRERDGYPIGEMFCQSHASLSPIRPIATSTDTIEGCTLREMLLADCPDLSSADLDSCQADLIELARDDAYTNERSCYQEWIWRLGGAANIPTYARVLAAGRETR